MQNKSNAKNRDDLKVIITATALTLTLAFWNLFSNGAQKTVQATNVEPTNAPTQALQGKILLGGPPPKTTIIVSQSGGSQPQSQRRRPNAVTNTSSSK
jgi:hypothetical protein